MMDPIHKYKIEDKKWRELIKILNESTDDEIERKKMMIKNSTSIMLIIFTFAIASYFLLSQSEYGLITGGISFAILFLICLAAFYLQLLSGSCWAISFMGPPFLILIIIKSIPENYIEKATSLFGAAFVFIVCITALARLISNFKFAKRIQRLGGNEIERIMNLINESPHFNENDKKRLADHIKKGGRLGFDDERHIRLCIFNAIN